jgi:hypothetical protein
MTPRMIMRALRPYLAYRRRKKLFRAIAAEELATAVSEARRRHRPSLHDQMMLREMVHEQLRMEIGR